MANDRVRIQSMIQRLVQAGATRLEVVDIMHGYLTADPITQFNCYVSIVTSRMDNVQYQLEWYRYVKRLGVI